MEVSFLRLKKMETTEYFTSILKADILALLLVMVWTGSMSVLQQVADVRIGKKCASLKVYFGMKLIA